MIHGELIRVRANDKQTQGRLMLFENWRLIFSCLTLELAWKNNQKCISCIPAIQGINVNKRHSTESGILDYQHWILEDIPNRDYILIHAGNFYTDIKGCILVGSGYTDINKDGYMDVMESKKTLFEMNNIMKSQGASSFTLDILNYKIQDLIY